jgi:hypothetical protein
MNVPVFARPVLARAPVFARNIRSLMRATPSSGHVAGRGSGGRAPGDVWCRKCGYNLRAADPGGRCPECGAPVAVSARPELLRFADPAWVATLASGVRFILWGTLVAAVVTAAGLSAFGESLLGGLVSIAGGLVHFYGAWLLTTPNPSTFGRDETLTARKVVRLTLAAGLVGTFLHTILVGAPLPAFVLVGLPILDVASRGAEATGEFARFRYLAFLAARVPDERLARRARQLGAWFAGCVLAMALGGGAAALLALAIPPSALPPALPAIAVAAAAGVGILLVVVMIWSLFVQHRLGKAFRAQRPWPARRGRSRSRRLGPPAVPDPGAPRIGYATREAGAVAKRRAGRAKRVNVRFLRVRRCETARRYAIR